MYLFVVFLFIFLLQSALAYVVTWFVARFLFPEASAQMLRKWRNGFGALMLTLPILVWGIFRFTLTRADLPPGSEPPATLSLLPAAWITMVIAAAILALTLTANKRAR